MLNGSITATMELMANTKNAKSSNSIAERVAEDSYISISFQQASIQNSAKYVMIEIVSKMGLRLSEVIKELPKVSSRESQ